MTDVLMAQWEKEKKDKKKWRPRRIAVEDMLINLEKDTWAKPGAKEDMGNTQ